jgi:phage shock protein C
MDNIKKLYRSDKDKTIAGIVGGLGEYFEVDSTLLRLIVLAGIFATGFFPGVIAYFLALLIVPKKPHA